MPLQLVWIGLRQYFATARKIFLAFIIFFAFMYLFFAFAGVDATRANTGPTVAEVEEARRANLYEIYSTKNDPVSDDNEMVMRAMTRGFMCAVTGELCTENPSEAHMYKQQSLSYRLSGLFAEPLKNPPSSFYYWAKGTLENAGFAPKTYAQGIGFAALTSFQPIWKVFRNLAYLIIVIVIVVVGFMVMFRVGGGGKNAVTLESALPKLVIALLAISMSYALAGLLIDVMYLSIALIINLLGPIAGMVSLGEQTRFISGIITGSPVDLLGTLLFGVGASDNDYYLLAGSLYSLVPWYFQAVIDGLVSNTLVGVLGSWKGGSLGKPTTSSNGKDIVTYVSRSLTNGVKKVYGALRGIKDVGQAGGGALEIGTVATLLHVLVGMIATGFMGGVVVRLGLALLLILGMIVIFYRLFFMLIGNYIEIILSVLTSPLTLMLEAIPGQNAFVNWVRGLAVCIGVYPIVLAIMLVTRAITNTAGTNVPMWAPPFVTQLTDQTSLQTIVAGVLIYSIPNIVKAYKQKLKPASAIDSMGIGLGSLFVGAAPIFRGSSTVLGASGMTGAMASRITKPLQQIFKLPATQTVKLVNEKFENQQ